MLSIICTPSSRQRATVSMKTQTENNIVKTTQVVVNSLITRSQHNDQSGIKTNVSVNINGYI